MALLSDSWIKDVLALFVCALVVLFFLAQQKYSYWERHGFKSVRGVSYLFGNFKRAFLQKETFAESLDRLYKSTSEPFVGIYTILRPCLLIRDPKLIQSILVSNFNSFTDRGIHCNEDNDPLSANLVALPGQKWKNMRAKLTPTFTTGKLKVIFI